MKNNTLRVRELLRALAPGEPVSGAALAERMGVTRAAVWKHVAALRDLGLPIDARTGLGYSLPWSTQLLDEAVIDGYLPEDCKGDVEVHWALDSTQSEMTRVADRTDLAAVLCEIQGAGRGRRGRAWLSPPGLNISLSCLKCFDQGFAGLSGLSLAVGVCVARVIEDLGVADVGLKWPNDILVGAGKLVGILIELSGEYQGPCTAVVGVGVNVRVPEPMRAAIDQPVTDLAMLLGAALPDRNLLVARLLAALRRGLRLFEAEGFAAFTDEFARLDCLYGKPVRLYTPRGVVDGVGAGVDEQGALFVDTEDGRQRMDSAEVSVRPRT